MPVSTVDGMKRMAELAGGARFPASLIRSVARCQNDPESVQRIGIHWATEQCRDLLDNEVRGIHFYTLNNSDATQQIYRCLGLHNHQK
jgi:methylenetetrahydrofolate reductase (NADPH)